MPRDRPPWAGLCVGPPTALNSKAKSMPLAGSIVSAVRMPGLVPALPESVTSPLFAATGGVRGLHERGRHRTETDRCAESRSAKVVKHGVHSWERGVAAAVPRWAAQHARPMSRLSAAGENRMRKPCEMCERRASSHKPHAPLMKVLHRAHNRLIPYSCNVGRKISVGGHAACPR